MQPSNPYTSKSYRPWSTKASNAEVFYWNTIFFPLSSAFFPTRPFSQLIKNCSSVKWSPNYLGLCLVLISSRPLCRRKSQLGCHWGALAAVASSQFQITAFTGQWPLLFIVLLSSDTDSSLHIEYFSIELKSKRPGSGGLTLSYFTHPSTTPPSSAQAGDRLQGCGRADYRLLWEWATFFHFQPFFVCGIWGGGCIGSRANLS